MSQAPEVRLLVAILDQAYDHPSWHGTNLRGSILGVSSKQAAWFILFVLAAFDGTAARVVSIERLQLVSTAGGPGRACLAFG